MWQVVLLMVGAIWAPARCYGDDDAQLIIPLAPLPVKGGHAAGRPWGQGPSLYRPQPSGSPYSSGAQPGASYGGQNYASAQQDLEVGVCYIEVPTVNLVRDRSHVPAGNGSRPDLSRIRTCCKGYERNIYNFRKCDPVCTKECINALCVAPDTCSCYPDHVKNLAGVCVATCPIGCQNGHCDGGECLCREGYKLDTDGKFCVPMCKDNCGGVGNCTAPNVCECNKAGYHASSDGSCRAACTRCDNGDCVAPNRCRCRSGYELDAQGDCKPTCQQNCGPNGRCVSPNICAYAGSPGSPNLNLQNPSDYVTRYPGHQIQNPSSQHLQNNSNSQFSYDGQQSSSGSGHYVINQESSQYPANPQNSLYPQLNSSGFIVRPIYSPSSYPQTPQNNSSGNVQYPSYIQQPSHSQYPSSDSLHHSSSVYNSSYNTQHSSHEQNSSTIFAQHPSQLPSYGPYYPSGTQYPSNQQQIPYGQHNMSGSLYPSNTQVPPYGQYNPAIYQYPANSQQEINPQQHYPSDFIQQSVYPLDQKLQSFQCAQPCVNSTCVEGKCVCFPGYVLDRSDPFDSRCNPSCPGGCTNGVCVAPHTCACSEGYFMQSGVKGARPRCVRRERRSLPDNSNRRRAKRALNVPELLVFMIPDYDN